MRLAIIIAGVVGLAVAGFFLVELGVDAVRRRQYVDMAVALAVVVATVVLLVVFGDSLLQ